MALSDPEWQFLVNAGKLKRCDTCKGRGQIQRKEGVRHWWSLCVDCQGDGYVTPPFRFNHF